VSPEYEHLHHSSPSIEPSMLDDSIQLQDYSYLDYSAITNTNQTDIVFDSSASSSPSPPSSPCSQISLFPPPSTSSSPDMSSFSSTSFLPDQVLNMNFDSPNKITDNFAQNLLQQQPRTELPRKSNGKGKPRFSGRNFHKHLGDTTTTTSPSQKIPIQKKIRSHRETKKQKARQNMRRMFCLVKQKDRKKLWGIDQAHVSKSLKELGGEPCRFILGNLGDLETAIRGIKNFYGASSSSSQIQDTFSLKITYLQEQVTNLRKELSSKKKGIDEPIVNEEIAEQRLSCWDSICETIKSLPELRQKNIIPPYFWINYTLSFFDE